MAKENFKKEDEQLESVNEALNSAGQWVMDYKKQLIIGFVVVLVLGVVSYWLFGVRMPNQAVEASNENAKAVEYFMQENWDKALNGDGAECVGFLAVADDYAMYQEGELASLYAGICYYKLGEWEEAAKYLKKFSAGDAMVDPASHQLLGDAYVQMGEFESALKAFDAAAKSENEIVAPMSLKKAGLVYMDLGKKEEAQKCFVKIRDNYPQSMEAQDIEKYIVFAQ